MTLNDDRQLATQEPITEEQPHLPPGADAGHLPPEPQDLTPEQRRTMVAIIIVLVLGVSLVIISIVWMAIQPPARVAHIRDIFIIWMAIMSLLVSIALVILMVQLARLINLLQNEIKPILDSINETTSHLRGTSMFLGDNLTEPVIKANEYFAGISELFATIGFFRRKPKPNKQNTKESE